MTDRSRGGRGPQPDPVRRPAPGVADLRGRLFAGFGTPEGNVFAGRGVLYQDTNPAGAGAIYKKTTASGKTGWVELGTGGGGTFAGCEYQMDADTAANTAAPLIFDLEIFAIDSQHSGGKFFPLADGWWVAWAYLRFFGSGTETDATLEGVATFSDSNDSYKRREENWPMWRSAGAPYGAGVVHMEPVLIDSSYVNPYFFFMANTHQMGSTGTPGGNLKGFATVHDAVCRAGIYRID